MTGFAISSDEGSSPIAVAMNKARVSRLAIAYARRGAQVFELLQTNEHCDTYLRYIYC